MSLTLTKSLTEMRNAEKTEKNPNLDLGSLKTPNHKIWGPDSDSL